MTEDIKRANMQVENCLVSVTESSSMHQKSLAIALCLDPLREFTAIPQAHWLDLLGMGRERGKGKA